MSSPRATAAAAVLVVCLVAALAASPMGQAHAAELISGSRQVSMDQLDASPVQPSGAQQTDAAAGQADILVRRSRSDSLSRLRLQLPR